MHAACILPIVESVTSDMQTVPLGSGTMLSTAQSRKMKKRELVGDLSAMA